MKAYVVSLDCGVVGVHHVLGDARRHLEDIATQGQVTELVWTSDFSSAFGLAYHALTGLSNAGFSVAIGHIDELDRNIAYGATYSLHEVDDDIYEDGAGRRVTTLYQPSLPGHQQVPGAYAESIPSVIEG